MFTVDVKKKTTVGKGPFELAVGGGGLDILTLIYPFSSLFLGVVGWCDSAGQTSSAGASY